MSANNVDTICPLSPLQHGMLHASLRERAAGLYVEQFSCVLVGALDVAAFHAAWQAVVDRHDVLKTLFLRLDTDKPVQVVRKRVTLPFFAEDWRDTDVDLDPADEAARFADLLAEDRRAGFDPAVAPLMRLRLARTGAQRHRFLWTYHHAILDGWSMPVLLREVFDHLGAPTRAPALPRADYRHYLAWLARQDVERSLAFWRERLAGFRSPVRFAPSVAPAQADPSTARRLATRHAALPPAWAEAASVRCRAARITLNTLCQAAWALLLAHYADTDDVVHGVVVSGRTADVPGIERMAGLFIGTLPVRTARDPGAAASDWLRRLQADTQDVERHAATPLARVLACAEVPRAQALFDTLYVFENYPGQSAFHALVAGHGLRVEDVHAVEETGYGLALIALPADGLQLQLTYDVAKFTPAAIDELLASYRRLLDRLLEIGDAALGTVYAGLVDETPESVANAAPTARADARPPAASAQGTAALPEHAGHTVDPGAIAQGSTLLEHAGRTVDRAAFARSVARGRAAWAGLDVQPGDAVLLACGDDPIAGLVALVSGVLSGLDVVVPEPGLGLDEAHAAAVEALGAAAPVHAFVALGDSDATVPACLMRCTPLVVPDASGVDAMAAPFDLDVEAGTVTWIGRTPGREPVALRHAWSDVVARARGAAARAEGGSGARRALAGVASAPAALATVLRAWFAGETATLFPAAPSAREIAAWLHALRRAPRGWDDVCLDGAQTRALAAVATRLDEAGDAWPDVPTAGSEPSMPQR